MKIDHTKVEVELIKKLFDLNEILDFQINHDIQIIRADDWQYVCYIDKEALGLGLTTMGAMINGIEQFKKSRKN